MKIESIHKVEEEVVITDIGTYKRYDDKLWQDPHDRNKFADPAMAKFLESKYQEFKQKNKFICGKQMSDSDYEYHLNTWGGFYNENYAKIHGHRSGDFWFSTAAERQKYVDELQQIQNELQAFQLVMNETEGYSCRTPTILHRVIEWEGKRYYSTYELGINFSFKVAEYHLQYKWYPGFNDYPLGEDFDYEANEVKIIQEWITGAYQDLDFERDNKLSL